MSEEKHREFKNSEKPENKEPVESSKYEALAGEIVRYLKIGATVENYRKAADLLKNPELFALNEIKRLEKFFTPSPRGHFYADRKKDLDYIKAAFKKIRSGMN